MDRSRSAWREAFRLIRYNLGVRRRERRARRADVDQAESPVDAMVRAGWNGGTMPESKPEDPADFSRQEQEALISYGRLYSVTDNRQVAATLALAAAVLILGDIFAEYSRRVTDRE